MCGALMTLASLSSGLSGWHRLLLVYVETGAGELARAQRRVQRRLVDDAAARRVDQIGRRLHARQPRGIEHADRLRRLRAMDGDEVGPRQGGVEIRHRLAARPP